MSVLIIQAKGYSYSPAIEKEPSLAWMQETVGGMIEIINLHLQDEKQIQMIVDEEGLLKEKAINGIGTALYLQMGILNGHPPTLDIIVGDIILLTEDNLCI